jgi:hypothetical protein
MEEKKVILTLTRVKHEGKDGVAVDFKGNKDALLNSVSSVINLAKMKLPKEDILAVVMVELMNLSQTEVITVHNELDQMIRNALKDLTPPPTE